MLTPSRTGWSAIEWEAAHEDNELVASVPSYEIGRARAGFEP